RRRAQHGLDLRGTAALATGSVGPRHGTGAWAGLAQAGRSYHRSRSGFGRPLPRLGQSRTLVSGAGRWRAAGRARRRGTVAGADRDSAATSRLVPRNTPRALSWRVDAATDRGNDYSPDAPGASTAPQP